jgi:hypothetical protein
MRVRWQEKPHLRRLPCAPEPRVGTPAGSPAPAVARHAEGSSLSQRPSSLEALRRLRAARADCRPALPRLPEPAGTEALDAAERPLAVPLSSGPVPRVRSPDRSSLAARVSRAPLPTPLRAAGWSTAGERRRAITSRMRRRLYSPPRSLCYYRASPHPRRRVDRAVSGLDARRGPDPHRRPRPAAASGRASHDRRIPRQGAAPARKTAAWPSALRPGNASAAI